jgi:gliding motility-associated-like protein
MTPTTAVSVCGSTTFTQNSISSCSGPTIPTSCIADLISSNSAWYRFHCYQAGPLGFTLAPQSGSDDYDWTVFDVTGLADPNAVFTNQSLQLSVNLCGLTAPTGCSAAGTSNVNCEGNFTSLWNQLIPLQTGHDYLLMVTNWSNTGQGYTLSFGDGTLITNNIAPVINSVSTVGCNSAQLSVAFSKDIRCNSATTTGSEFLIMPGNIPATGITSLCATGTDVINALTISLAAPLPAGNYNLVVNNGTDGNTFRDACDADLAAGSQIPFTIASQGAPVVTAITSSGCAPTVLNVTFSNPILCNTITPGGSEFSIPGGPAITAVQSTCGPLVPYSNTLQVILQNPLPHGSYQLVINNGTDGNALIDTCNAAIGAGYTFPFVISQATVAPAIQSVSFDECHPAKLVLNFDKPVSCNSLTAAGSEISITPGTWPISGVASSCGAGNTTTQLILTLQNNLPAGNFNVNINTGSDGNTLADTCFAFIAGGYTKSFVTTQSPSPVFDSVQFADCNPSQIKVFYNHPINCGTVTVSGSEFFITGPSPVNIVSVSGDPATCSTSYSSWFILQLAQPINTFGAYVLHNRIGVDGNGMIDTCSAAQNITETISFNVSVKPTAVFSSQVRWGCASDTIALSHPGGDGIDSWTWNFSDGTSVSGPNATPSFPVATATATIQLIVSNGSCADSVTVDIPLNNAFNAVFTQGADTTCMGKTVTFSNGSTGNNLQYEWRFGDNTTFNGQTPPPHTYAANSGYTVSLICTNDHGCSDTATRSVYATALPVIGFSGLNNKYCTRESVSLVADIQGNIGSYTWNNGNNTTFQNTAAVTFFYTQQNTYTITLSANDRFCGTAEHSETTDVYLVPVVMLGRDTALCPETRLQIGLPNNNGLTYLWNTGAVTSQIFTGLSSDTYVLSVDNHGCKGQDDMYVDMLDGCLIRVAGAFTPNNDGRNDKLKAINAFLATHFTLKVYNRFGQLLFSTNNPLEGWDGRFRGQEESPGTYVWQVSYTDPWTHLPVYQKGTSILIR